MILPLRSSSIAAYLECPRRAHHIYVERRRGRTVPAMALGTMAHAGIETMLRAKIDGRPTPLHDALAAAANVPADTDFGGSEDDAQTTVQRAQTIVHAYARDVAPLVSPIDVERRVEADIDGANVTGIIDVLESSCVRDTKTTRKAPTPWGDPRHRFQLGLYAALVERGCFDATPKTAVVDYLVLSERKPRATKANPEPTVERTVRYLPVVLDEADLADEKQSAIAVLADVSRRTKAGEYPCNPLACVSWGRPCEFLPECYPQRARVLSSVKEEVPENV